MGLRLPLSKGARERLHLRFLRVADLQIERVRQVRTVGSAVLVGRACPNESGRAASTPKKSLLGVMVRDSFA
jgi:hypothetical protein